MTIKKYRLEKLYPGSPKLHSIIDNTNYQHNNMIINVLDYPEFWKEYIEKDYEILSFKWNYGHINNPIYTLKDGLYCHNWNIETTNKYTKEFLLNFPNYIIYSVKRLSDGEIFTIGDNFYPNQYSQSVHSFRTIHILDLLNDKISINKDANFLSHIIKCTKPLFITEDGVDIFEGDKYYTIGTSQGIWYHDKTIIEESIAKIGTGQLHEPKCIQGNKLYWIRLSTKEKAEEYIFYNKPCLSLNDVASIFVSATKEITNTTSLTAQNRRIQELVKSKIK